MTQEETATLIGTSIGNYQVLSLLGAGAMGEVYLGEHPQIGRKVAIKVLVSALSASPEMADRFISEARAVNKINHPNIIQIFDFGQLPNGRLYYTMEFLEGRELTHILKEQAPLSLADAVDLVRQIAAALDAAHAVGIVHRDLKPDNIFVLDTPSGRVVKVLDFGIAKLLEPDLSSQHRTSTGMIMGTPQYMSPEQAAGDVSNISPRSDIYALGVIAYHMFSGRFPLEAPTTAQLLAKHITEMPRPLHAVTQGLPEPVSNTVQKALEKSPDSRQETAGQFYRDLYTSCAGAHPGMVPTPVGAATQQGYAAPGGGLATGPAAHAPTTLGSTASQAVQGSLTGEFKKPRIRLAGLLVVIGVLAVAVAAGVFIATRPGKKASKKKKPVAASPEPMAEPMEPPMVEPPAMATYRIYTVHVRSKTKHARFKVRIAGQAEMKKWPPFKIKVKEGERVTLTAFRKGFEEQVETFLATADRKLVFTLERRRRGSRRTRAAGSRVATRIAGRLSRPRPRPRPRGMSSVGEGTLKPTFR